MTIHDIPNKKWTKGMILQCLLSEFKDIEFVKSPQKCLEYNGSIHIRIEPDLHPSYVDKALIDAYIKFFAEPTAAPITGLRLWPAAMDIHYIKCIYGYRDKKSTYLLGQDQSFASTQLHEDVQKYVIPFFNTIKETDGYFKFLLGRLNSKRPREIKEIFSQETGLLIVALITAHKLSFSEYAIEAATTLQKTRHIPGQPQRQIDGVVERLPEIEKLLDTYGT